MRRLVIIISLIPILASWFVAKAMGSRRLGGHGSQRTSAGELLEKLTKGTNIKVRVKRKFWGGEVIASPGECLLDQATATSHLTTAHGKALLYFGLALLADVHEDSVKWRMKARKLSFVIPPFALMIVGAAAIAGRMSPILLIAAFFSTFALTCLMLLMSLSVEKQAARRAIAVLEDSRAIARIRDEEAISEACLGWAHLHALPHILHGFLGVKHPKVEKKAKES